MQHKTTSLALHTALFPARLKRNLLFYILTSHRRTICLKNVPWFAVMHCRISKNICHCSKECPVTVFSQNSHVISTAKAIFQCEEFVQIRTDFIQWTSKQHTNYKCNGMNKKHHGHHNEKNEVFGNFSDIFSIKGSLWRSSLQRLQSTGCTSSASLGHLCSNLESQKQSNSCCVMELSAFP